MRDDKRQLRKLKREIKRAGNKRRRYALKQQLAEGRLDDDLPGEGLGRSRSAWLNNLDQDATRRRRGG
jgi:hypothetical protein